jgi:hypothetical protein
VTVGIVAGTLLAATLAGMPNATADNGCTGVLNQGNCHPAPWNGQLMPTWDSVTATPHSATTGPLRWRSAKK